MVVEDELSYLFAFRIVKHVGNLVGSRFHYKHVNPIAYLPVEVGKFADVTREENSLTLGFNEVGVCMPACASVLTEMSCVKCCDRYVFVIAVCEEFSPASNQ